MHEHNEPLDAPEASVDQEQQQGLEDFKPFSLIKFFLLIFGALIGIFVIIFILGFIGGLSGTRPASFDNEIIQRQIDEMMGQDVNTPPNELVKIEEP